ncbi:hypothetical protein RN001_005565 [Aquatica leii]|uniref:MADF domain-containing protein n=1 Tax=Aquatica leii TaxID=1421715 RepID=A0AAN7PK21_9COLE|nr:hypothetical protein RN001_005565 [Aquatica leii]
MSWSRDEVALLIEEYKKYPCLYATKSKEYKNKHARGRALQNIEAELRLIKPDVTANDIKVKFYGIKTNFLAEHRKHAKSIHSGAGDDDIYIPTLWYFDKLRFVLEHCIQREAIDTINGKSSCAVEREPEIDFNNSPYSLQEDESYTYEVENVNTLQFVESSEVNAENSNGEGVPSRTPKRRKMNKTNVLEDAGKAIKLVGEALQQRTQNKKVSRGEVDIFRDFVASQLRKIHPELKDDVEQEIAMVLFNNIKKSKQLYNNETVFLD